MKKDLVIGILGGMGTYATIHAFKQYAEIFEAEKEWDRPRIIIDNRCTMPSRVRAYLYKENEDVLVEQMEESISNLIKSGANKIILACNTSHLFLEKIYNRNPILKEYVVNIIECCSNKIKKSNINGKILILGSEGTIDSEIYQKSLTEENINYDVPKKEEYEMIRMCIEAVKQNKFTSEAKDVFCELAKRNSSCILGCTELPILYEKYKDCIKGIEVYDPIKVTLEYIKENYYEE